ncbi:MAG: putative Fe-S cluster assembly protein SufT [Candidatus Acidiferrales bacterium]
MSATTNTPIKLNREAEVIEIPSGVKAKLPAGAEVRVMQFVGSSYTIVSDYGMFRIDVKDADAIGLTPAAAAGGSEASQQFNEKLVWDQLKTVYDPEIPVNVADLGLIYSCDITPVEGGDHRIDIKMSMTAPGCGMGNVLKADVESKLADLPTVKEVNVELVFDPPWGPARMSEAARLQLGFDL